MKKDKTDRQAKPDSAPVADTNAEAGASPRKDSRHGQIGEAFRKLLGVLSRPHSMDFLQRGIEALVLVLRADHGAVVMLDDRKQVKEVVSAGAKLKGTKSVARFMEHRRPLIEEVMGTNAPLRVDDVFRHLRDAGKPITFPTLQAFLGVPVSHEGTVFGCVYLCDPRGTVFCEEDEMFVASFAQGLALVMAQSRERAQRKAAEERLHRSEEQYRELVDSIDAIVWEFDPKSLQANYVNGRIESILGWRPDQCVGAADAWLRLIDERDRERVASSRRASAEQGGCSELEYRAVGPDGRVVWLHERLRATGGQNAEPERVLRGVAVDVTDRKETERQQALFSALAADLSAAATAERLGETLGQSLEGVWPWTGFAFLVRRSGAGRFQAVYQAWDDETERHTRGWDFRDPVSDFDVAQLGNERVAVLTGSSGAIASTVPALVRLGQPEPSIVCAAIPPDEGAVALVMFTLPEGAPPVARQDRQLLARLAEFVAPAVVRCRAEMQSSAFSSLGHQLSMASNPLEAAEIIVDVADRLIGWDACSVYLFNAEDDTGQGIMHMDLVDGERKMVGAFSLDGTPSSIAMRTIMEGPQLILRDKPEFTENTRPFGDKGRPSASAMFVPLRVEGKATGVLSIQSYTPRAYDRRDVEVLQALADHCSGALERTRSAMPPEGYDTAYKNP